jgi:ribosome biogenesis protein MAK21
VSSSSYSLKTKILTVGLCTYRLPALVHRILVYFRESIAEWSGKISNTIQFPNSRKFNSKNSVAMGKKRYTSAKDPHLKSAPATLPSFDERALSALTDKIESGFRNTAAVSKADSLDRNRPPTTNPRSRIKKSKNTKTTTKHHVAGRKRDAKGNIIEQGSNGSKAPKIGTDDANGETQDEKSVLLREILALGGTQEDLSLVMEVATDDEDAGDSGREQPSAIDPKLAKELSKFIDGLGIETQRNQDSSGTESDEEEDANEDDEHLPNHAILESKPTNTTGKVETPVLKEAKNLGKGKKDLVSKSLPVTRATLY